MITGFIGAGRAGCSIGKYLAEADIPVAGYYDLSKEAAHSAAAFTGSKPYDDPAALVAQCHLLFITTPDGLIRQAWETLRHYPLDGKIICHCSGAMPASVFSGIAQTNAYGCSLHPMLPFDNRFSSYQILERAFFTVEGDPYAVEAVSGLFTGLGNTVCQISGECKPKYHAAASILSNQVAAVLDTGYRLLEECGFSRQDARTATDMLIQQNVKNCIQKDCIQALTGPIERNDAKTVQKHLDCLDAEDQDMYRVLGAKLVKIAKKKNPGTDYSALQALLETAAQHNK